MSKIDSKKIKDLLDDVEEEIKNKGESLILQELNIKNSNKIDTVKDTIQQATERYREDQTITDIPQLMHSDFVETDYAFLVNDLVNKSIDEVVEEKIREARILYNESDIASAITTADAYYNKILNSQRIMTSLRNDFSKVLQQKSADMINDKMLSLQNKVGHKWFTKILKESKITRILIEAVDNSIADMVGMIISDKMIANVSNDLITSVNKLIKKSKDKFKDVFKDEIAYYKKAKKAVEDKIELYKQKKKEYQIKLQKGVERLRSFVNDQIKKAQDAIISEVSKFVKIDAGAVADTVGGIF